MKSMPCSDDKYQTEDDARTLERHAEVCADPKRTKNATAKLTEKRDALNKVLEGKVKKGLKKAFPKKADDRDED